MLPTDEKIFSRFDEKLGERNLRLSIICVGGYVLRFHGIRETVDIDAFFTNTPEIQSIIKEIGQEFGLNSSDEDWLNSSVQNLNDAPDESICSKIYTGKNLTVAIPPLLYVAGMKLISEREIDISDVAQIISSLHSKDPVEFRNGLMQYGFGFVDEALILEAFSEAYGMEWLEEYYRKHESDFTKNIDSLSSGSYDAVFDRRAFGFGTESKIKNFELRKDFIKCREEILGKLLKIPTMQGRTEAFYDEMKKRLLEKYSNDEVAQALNSFTQYVPYVKKQPSAPNFELSFQDDV